MCLHCALWEKITGIFLGWDSNPQPCHYTLYSWFIKSATQFLSNDFCLFSLLAWFRFRFVLISFLYFSQKFDANTLLCLTYYNGCMMMYNLFSRTNQFVFVPNKITIMTPAQVFPPTNTICCYLVIVESFLLWCFQNHASKMYYENTRLDTVGIPGSEI